MSKERAIRVTIGPTVANGVFACATALPENSFSGGKVSKHNDTFYYAKDYVLWSVSLAHEAPNPKKLLEMQQFFFEMQFLSEVYESEFLVAEVEMSVSGKCVTGTVMLEQSGDGKTCLYSYSLVEVLAYATYESTSAQSALAVLEGWLLRERNETEIKIPIG